MECDGTGSLKWEMVSSLQSRKEALEAKINERNLELKRICIQEAELTGVLPPETPLELGESPPVFRRRVGTAFTYPENLINNKLKSKDEESLATLELECKIQTGIAEASLGLANDGAASKSVRRKHRLMYQQSQRRLLELEARLSFLRRQHGHKQRKKPRPPLESDGDSVDGMLQDSGICLSPLDPSDQSLSLSVSDQCVRHSNSYNGFPRPSNANAPMTLPLKSNNHRLINQNRRQYHQAISAQGMEHGRLSSNPGYLGREQDGDSVDGILHEGGISLSPLSPSHQPLHLSVSDQCIRHLNSYNEFPRHSDTDAPMTLLPRKANNQRQDSQSHMVGPSWQYHQSMSTQDIESSMLSSKTGPLGREEGYYTYDNIWYNTAPSSSRFQHTLSGCEDVDRDRSRDRYLDRFGSLDRRRERGHPPSRSNSSVEDYETNQLQQHPSSNSVLFTHPRFQTLYSTHLAPSRTPPTVLLPSQTYPENSLMRTQSLGNVEPGSKGSVAISMSQQLCDTFAANKVQGHSDMHLLSSGHCHSDTILVGKVHGHSVAGKAQTHSDVLPVNKNQFHCDTLGRKSKEKEWYETSLDAAPIHPPPQSPASPIPHAHHSSSPIQNSPTTQQLNFDTVVPYESPKNHTVVQAGKWQPYREVTKPFEMSDFYKYSTKFRKNGPSSIGSRPAEGIVAPQQKAVYQPLQPMTCQPLQQNHNNQGGPPALVKDTPDPSQRPTNSKGQPQSSDASLSNEMLTWYQDQSIAQPRTATLV